MPSADPGKLLALPGNDELTFAIDLVAYNVVGTTVRCFTMFNRAIGTATQAPVQYRFGHLFFMGYEVGSTKAGVDLLRPKWRFEELATAISASSAGCGNRVRSNTMNRTNPRWTMPCVVFWRPQGSTVADELPVTGEFTWADKWAGTGGTLCY